jgi:kynurenine formamidase
MRMINGLAVGVLLSVGASLAAQGPPAAWQPPPDSQRCPSRWGASDERGSGNHMGRDSVLRATRLIRTGEVIELGHVLSAAMPLRGSRRFDVTLKRTAVNPGVNRRAGNEEIVHSEIGQVGTQLDAFGHQTIGSSVYNCLALDEITTRTGFTKLGVEGVGMLMTRGVLIDVAAAKGVEVLADRYEITARDLQDALARQGQMLQPGDAVVVHTGWGRLWSRDGARYGAGGPGIGVEAAEWLARQDPMLVGSDTSAVEVDPNPDPRLSLPVHQIMLVVNGIHLLENLKLDELAASGASEFALMLQPLKIQGGTGSTVAPVAIR